MMEANYETKWRGNVQWKDVLSYNLESLRQAGSVDYSYNPSYLGGRVWKDPSSRPAQTKHSWGSVSASGWAWWHVSVNPALWGSTNRITVQASQDLKWDCISKITKAKRAGSVTQVVEYLSSKHKALSSTPNTTKKKKKKISKVIKVIKYVCQE
jgi:hypothetical protein